MIKKSPKNSIALAAALALTPACTSPGEIGGNVDKQNNAIDGAECLDVAIQNTREEIELHINDVLFYQEQDNGNYGVRVDTKLYTFGEEVEEIICIAEDQFGEIYVALQSQIATGSRNSFYPLPESTVTAPNFELTLWCTESCNQLIPLRDCTSGAESCDYLGTGGYDSFDLAPSTNN